ncbi:DUF4188 domain-containing protein [uncultured Pseudokineococcus sp.]|uniref:DUF4188 domain-containing protein n=1 Tax=uncultured Pseudokineococcus sp. TaxID=1642928 RepID=UPI002616A91B|nr:DUF4188 domain-containing protein [uncultured Pseudokineococcus sp.]
MASTQVHAGRRTADLDGQDVVVFVIGMRFNRLRDVRAWLPVFGAMPRMLRELAQQPERGLLHARTYWSGRTLMVRQYWRSWELLQQYASASDAEHLPAWRAFNQRARRGGAAVGIFHETYLVGPGRAESVYVQMPEHGLAAATRSVPVPPRGERAADRMRGDVAPRSGRS